MTTVIGVALFCAVGFKWYDMVSDGEWSWTNYQCLSLIFGLTTAFGISSVGVWELNQHSKVHKIMHYLGGLGLVTIGLAVLFEFRFSAFSIFVFVVNIILWSVYWFVSTYWYQVEYVDDAKRVHFVSMVCITLEVIAWLMLAFTIILFVYHLH